MDARNENKFSMEITLRDFLNQSATQTSSLPGFEKLFSTFSENIDKIRSIRELQEKDKSGIAKGKGQLRNDLIVQVLDISRKILAYAKMTDNAPLIAEAYFPETDLRQSTGNLLTDRALLIYDLAMTNQSALEPYGVTPEMLTEFKKIIGQFSAAIPKPRRGIIEKKQATNQLGNLFAANDTLLDKLDALVEVVHYSQPPFYEAYWESRKVIYTGNGMLALKAYITDATTREGIRGVTVSFTYQNGNPAVDTKFGKKFVKVTSEKGIFRIKSMKPGGYTAVLTKPGFKELTMTVTIANGEMTKMTAELERN